MAIYKYTVANTEGKKLSGTVEAPDETVARTELNNLGFSIIQLTETTEMPTVDNKLKKFVFEAIDKNSKLVNGTIPSEDEKNAFEKLTKEYALQVTAIWIEGASASDIEKARKEGVDKMQKQIQEIQLKSEEKMEESMERLKEEAQTKSKVENILKEVHILLTKFDKDFDENQKNEINKKINKLLRIKNSTNLKYILSTAEELLILIQEQEKGLKEKGYQEKRIKLEVETKNLLNELKKTTKPKTLSEDILSKIENWQKHHVTGENAGEASKLVSTFLGKIKEYFKQPEGLLVIKDQIKIYNYQLWDFIKLYFKEPTPEYKEKVKNALKSVWKARLKAVHSYNQAKKLYRQRDKRKQIGEASLLTSLVREFNSFSGWLLSFYIMYYFASLYLTTKDFGIDSIPQGFEIYDSKYFKYILAILFLFHASTALKINFFNKNSIAGILLPIFFVIGSTIVILNF